LTEYELVSLIGLARETSGRVIEYFITASTAVVVGSFFASKYVSPNMSRYISIAYLIAVAFCVSSQVDASIRIAHYVSLLSERGADTSSIVNTASYAQFASIILLHILVVGGTLYFSWFMAGRAAQEQSNA
jgi:hypothetical protein